MRTLRTIRRRSGFSLIEVMLSLVVVGGGLVAVFGLFPVGLRQGVDARSDMAQASFASTLFETISANVRAIDNLEEWEDVDKWWKKAVGSGTNLSKFRRKDARSFASDTSLTLRTREKAMAASDDGRPKALAAKDIEGKFGDECVFYVAREETEKDTLGRVGISDFILPPQFLIRIVKVERHARRFSGLGQSSSKIDWNTYKNDTWKNDERRLSPPRNVTVRNLQVNDDDLIVEANGEETSGRNVIRLPSRYIVSVVSSDMPFPQPYVDNPVFSQEFAFLHRP